jgi:hypothetical protein
MTREQNCTYRKPIRQHIINGAVLHKTNLYQIEVKIQLKG